MQRDPRLPKEQPHLSQGFGVPATVGSTTALVLSLLPARYAKVHSTDAAGDLTVTWPVGRFAVAPVVDVSVLGLVGLEFAVHLVSVDSSGCVIKVRKFGSLSFNLLGLGTLNLLVAPGATSVHVVAVANSGD